MDSYPSEFTAHVSPLMFVAGLGTTTTPIPPPPPFQSPATPPSADPTQRPSLPGDSAPASTSAEDPFGPLLLALKNTIVPKKTFVVWDNTRGANNDFHVVLVAKNARFPPLKARPPSTPQQPAAPLHSPISPLTPTSPLYPDGIIAPIWIRKHREMVPSVFILVLRLAEVPVEQHGPLESSGRNEEEERAMDAEIVREVVDRKRSTLERGIKLAVILVCSRRLLDDPSLDSRLSLIRRQSGLDSRASLFVISPVPQSEVAQFVASLRAELYPAALDYYREHGRRVRRKRARQVPKGKLSDKGWSVRYDYKIAIFSELRGEMEVALKHYEDSYETLVDLLGTPAILAPRTKRWAEAKVLADCLTLKICKTYLYLNESTRCVSQLNRHVVRFRDLSNVWGISEDTFEYWSWLSKQYRLFGDLVAIAIRAGFRLPSLKPPPAARPGIPSVPQSSGLVPSTVLFHPGFYFFLAGQCAVNRRERYKLLPPPQEGVPVPPAIAHEMKVDHTEIIIDLYTKAYEFFKAHKSSRMSLYVASLISQIHYDNGRFDLTLRFHERISKTYRREHWISILSSLYQNTYRAALQLGQYETAIQSLLTLLAPDALMTPQQSEICSVQLLDILKNKHPATPDQGKVIVDLSDMNPIFECTLAFEKTTSHVGERVPFQLVVKAPSKAWISELHFSQLAFQVNDGRPLISIPHSDEAGASRLIAGGSMYYHDVGNVGNVHSSETPESSLAPAKLLWSQDAVHVFCGTLTVTRDLALTFSTVTLTLAEGDWSVDIVMVPKAPTNRVWVTDTPPFRSRLLEDHPSVCNFSRRDLKVMANIDRAVPAYLDEKFAITVHLTNQDDVEVEVSLDVLLQPGEDDSRNLLLIDDQTSSSLVKGIVLGSLSPGDSLHKTFHLLCVGSPGERLVDVSVRSQPKASSLPEEMLPSTTEILQTLAIPAVPALLAMFDTYFHARRQPTKKLLDFDPPTGWESASDVTMVVKLYAHGPWDLDIAGIRLAYDGNPLVKTVKSSLPPETSDPLNLVLSPGDLFNVVWQLQVAPALTEHEKVTDVQGVRLEVLWKRNGESGAPWCTRIPVTRLRPLPLSPGVTVRVPTFMTRHEPTPLSYCVSNPTDRVVTVSIQVDGSESFVFAGPRKIPRLVLAPSEERQFRLNMVPLSIGQVALPRVRVFEHERTPDGTAEGEGGDGATGSSSAASPIPQRVPSSTTQTTVHELTVVGEYDVEEVKDPAQIRMETDLRQARGGDEVLAGQGAAKPLTTLVLPKSTTVI